MFIRGWYNVLTEADMGAIRAYGANTVISYPLSLEDTYGGGRHTPTGYRDGLISYLDAAERNGLKVIVKMKTHHYDGTNTLQVLREDSLIAYLDTVLSSSTIRSHPAVLGWESWEEPRIAESAIETRALLESRYDRIRSYDTTHPVFVCFSVPRVFNATYPIRNDPLSAFYDVLMLDFYPCHVGDVFPDYDDIGETGWVNKELNSRFVAEKGSAAGTLGTTIFVAQGSEDASVSPHLRTPEIGEVKYQLFDAIIRGQAPAKGGNTGGVMHFWWGANDREGRANVQAVMGYFAQQELDKIVYSPNLNSRCEGLWPFEYMLRYYNGAYWLLNIVEDTVDSASCIFQLEFGSGIVDCREIRVGESDVDLWSSISEIGPGRYSLPQTRREREASLIRFSQVEIDGPTVVSHPRRTNDPPSEFTWSADVEPGMPPISFTWKRNGVPVGTGSIYSERFSFALGSPASFVLSLEVQDSAGFRATRTIKVDEIFSDTSITSNP